MPAASVVPAQHVTLLDWFPVGPQSSLCPATHFRLYWLWFLIPPWEFRLSSIPGECHDSALSKFITLFVAVDGLYPILLGVALSLSSLKVVHCGG